MSDDTRNVIWFEKLRRGTPSNDPSFAKPLANAGIDTIPLTPDSVVALARNVAEAEAAGA